MATILDALVVTLGIDSRDYEKKSKQANATLAKFAEASSKQSKLIAEQGKKAAGAFSALKVEVLGALAAFGMGAGFKAFIRDSMNGQAQLGRLSASLGMSTHALQAWQLMAKEMGGTGAEATGTLQTVASGLAAARRGDPSFLVNANKYGAGLTFDDNTQSAMAKINQMAFAIRQKYGEQQAMGVLRGMGIGDFLQQQRLMESPQKFAADMAHAMSMTGAATKASTEQAERLQAQWADLQERFRQVGERVFNQLEPVLSKLGERLANWIDAWVKGGGVNKMITAIGNFIDKIQQVVKEMGGWKTIAEILGGVLALQILAPVITLTGTLARLPMLLVGASTGVSGLAAAFGTLGVALAGAAAYWAGSELWTHVLAGTRAGDAVGKVAAYTMAQLGDKNAQDAVNRMNGRGPKVPNYYHPERTAWYKAKETQAIQYFESQGFPRNAAIGMTANIAAESTFNQRATGDHGQAYGIGQWHPDRQANFARVMHLPIQASSYEQQLQFYAYEVKHNKRLMGILSQNPTAGASAMAVSYMDERPADASGEAQRRAVLAQGIVNAHIGAPNAAQVAAKTATATTNTVTITNMTVNTKATDSNGIAKSIQKAVQSHPLIMGSVTSLS